MAIEEQIQVDINGDPIEKLYKVVKDKGLYTKSLEEFKTKYSTPESIDRLYSVVNQKGLYTKSKEEFSGQYFAPLKKKEVSGESSSATSPNTLSSWFAQSRSSEGKADEQPVDKNNNGEDPLKETLDPIRQEMGNQFSNWVKVGRQNLSESTAQKFLTKPQQNSITKERRKEQVGDPTALVKMSNIESQAKKELLPNGEIAKKVIDNYAQAKGITLDQLPKNNETINAAVEKVKEYEEDAKDILETGSIERAAIIQKLRNDKHFADQFKALQEGNPYNINDYETLLPESLRGRIVADFISKGNAGIIAENNKDVVSDYDKLSNGVLSAFPEFGVNVVANELSREREKRGKNNPIANVAFGSSEYMDKLANEIYKDDPEKLKLYNDVIKNNLNQYIDTPDFLSRAVGSFKHAFEGTGETIRELSGTESNADKLYQALDEENKQISAQPKGINKFSSVAGDFGGLIAYMGLSGGAIRGLGLTKSPAIANAIMTGATFYGDEKKEARKLFPNDPLKQDIRAGVNTAAFMAAGNIFKAPKQLSNFVTQIKPELDNIFKRAMSGEISKEAARDLSANVFQKGLEAGGKALAQNLKGTGEMVALTMFKRGLDRTLGLDSQKFNEIHQAGEDWDVAKMTFMGLALPSIAGASGSKPMAKEALYEVATNPLRFKRVNESQGITDPDYFFQKNANNDNIEFLAKTKSELDGAGLPKKLQKSYLLQAMNERQLTEKAESITDPTLKKNVTDQIKKSQEAKEAILKGKDVDILPQEVNDDNLKENQKFLKEMFEGDESGSFLKAADRDLLGGKKFDKDKVAEYLKFVAQQANNVTADGKIDTKIDSRKAAAERFDKAIIDAANEMYPEYKKLGDSQGEIAETEIEAAAKGSSISVIQPGENPQREIITISPKENIKQNESAEQRIIPEENKGVENNTQPVIEESPEKQRKISERYNEIINEHDLSTPYDTAVKYFADGGKVNPSEIERLFGGKGDKTARIGMIKNDAGTIDQIAHQLWEADKTGRYDTMQYRDAVESALSDFNSKTAAQKDIIERYDIDAAYEKYMAQAHGKDAIDIVEKMTDGEINDLLRLDAEKKSEAEMDAHIEAIIKTHGKSENTKDTQSAETKSGEPSEPNEAGKTTEGSAEEIRLSHSDTQKIYEELGLPERLETPTKKDKELVENADKMVKGGYDFDKEAEKVMSGEKKSFTDEEQVAFAKAVAALKSKQEGLDIKSPEFEALQDKIEKYSRASDVVGTLEGRSFRARQVFVPKEETLSDYVMTEKYESGVDTLTDVQKETIQKEYNEISSLEKALQDKVAKLEAENSKLKADLEVKKMASSAKPVKKDFKAERKEIFQSIQEKLRKARGEANVTPIPYAKELFIIAPDVAKLVKNLVEQGVTELVEIVKSVHSGLKEDIPGIREQDVQDIIAGNYNEKKVTRKATAIKLQDLKTEANLLNKLEQLNSGAEPKVENKRVARNRKIKELQDAIGEHDLTKLAQLKTRVKSEIAKVEEQLRKGDFAPEEKKAELRLDKEAIELKDKLIKAKNERQFRRMKQVLDKQSAFKKGMRGVSNALNIPRALMSTLDFSALLRQAVIPVVANPKMTFGIKRVDGKTKFTGAAFEMFRSAFSEKNYDRWFYELAESPRYELMKESKLALTEAQTPDLKAKEEEFMTNLVDKIPVVGQLTKGSERAYSQLLNKMRVDLFNRFADSMEERGLTFKNSPEAYKQMAAYVNNSTGRGDLGKTLNTAAPFLNAMFFSPRLISSRINMLTYLLQPRFYTKVPREVRAAYFKDMAKFIGVGITVLALAKLNGADVDDDPRSSDFGKIKVGDTRWDIWGGFQQYAKIGTQLLTGQSVSTTTGKVQELNGEGAYGRDRSDVLGTSLRGKLAPVPSMALDLIKGRNIVGEKIQLGQWRSGKEDNGKPTVGAGEYMAQHFLPLTITGIQESMKDQGVKALFTVGVPSIFGVGTQTYSETKSSSSKKRSTKEKTKKSTKKSTKD